VGLRARSTFALLGSLAALLAFGAGGGARAESLVVTSVSTSFRSRALGEPLHFVAYLPPGYATSALRYPVIYFLHGLPAPPTAYQGAQWASAALQQTGGEAIVVAPQGASSTQSDPEYHDWGPGEDWETAIGVELPAYVDAHYRTIRSRSARAIVGFSAGGYGATMLALHHPATFGAFESWSGYFRATDPTGETTLDLPDSTVYTLVPSLRNQLARYPTFIAFYVGRSDPTFVPDNLKLNGALNSVGVHHVFALYNGGHTATLWQSHATQWFGLALSHLADARAG